MAGILEGQKKIDHMFSGFDTVDVEEYRDLEISPCEFMHDLYIAEIYRPGVVRHSFLKRR